MVPSSSTSTPVCVPAAHGAFVQPFEELAQAVGTTPSIIAMNVDELEERAVCCIRRDQSPQTHARNPRQLLAVPEATATRLRNLSGGGVRPEGARLFLAPACVQASFSAADEKLALGMYRRGVFMEQITRASCWDVPASMSPCSTPEPESDHQPAILRRRRRGSDRIGDTGKLLGAAPLEGAADGTTVAAGPSSKT